MNRLTKGRAPNYTVAALVAICVNLFCLLLAVWAIWGLASVLLLAVALDALIRRLDHHRNPSG